MMVVLARVEEEGRASISAFNCLSFSFGLSNGRTGPCSRVRMASQPPEADGSAEGEDGVVVVGGSEVGMRVLGRVGSVQRVQGRSLGWRWI